MQNEMWVKYRLRMTFLTNLCASVPADPALIKAWLEAWQPSVRAPGARSIEEINEEVLDSLATGEADEKPVCQFLVFQRHKGVLVMRAGTVRAHIKDCARVLSNQYVGKVKGERAFSTRIINGVYIDPAQYWLPILRDGQTVSQADDTKDKGISVTGPRGKFSALKRFELMSAGATMVVPVWVLGKSATESDLHHLFSYGGVHGYGGERGDGEGRYDYQLERVGAESECAADPVGRGVVSEARGSVGRSRTRTAQPQNV